MTLKRKVVNMLFGIVLTIIVLVIDATSVSADTGFIPFVPVNGSTASGNNNGQFSYPYYVAVDSSGNVYVSDSNNNRIQKFDSSGNFLMKWGSSGTGNGQFSSPMGITVDKDGNILVVDYINDPHIQKFDPNGNFLAGWGSQGYTDGKFDRPDGIAVDSSGNIYVTDNVRKYIQKFDSNGNFLAKFSGPGSADNQLGYPNGIAIDSSGNIYVVDNVSNCIKKFDSEGTFQLKWGFGGTGDGQFIMPYGIAADSSDNVYVTDGGNNRIQKFDSNGHFLAKWGSNGSDIGQFYYPKGIMVDSDKNVFVADYANNRIMVLAPTLEATSTIKGQTITDLGRPSLKLDYVTAGALTITGEQAADTTDVAPYATLFDTGSANAIVKVVKYAAGSDTGSFDTDIAYAGEAVANGDFFIVGLTATEGTKVVYYKINVTVPPATLTSFAFDGLAPAVTGIIDSTAKTIKLLVPSGTDVTKLTPTIIYTGKSVLPASGTEQDFTNPVKYTFVDFYGTKQDYYVTVFTEFGGGDGSQENPYQITKLEHLNNMRNHLDKHFTLMNDLKFSRDTDYMDIANKTTWTSGAGWTPVGTDLSRFTGSFDGGSHTINGLIIYSPAKYLGLFGYIASGAEVKDILLESVSVRSSTGGLYIGGLAGASDGAVTGCGVSGSVTGYSYVGGLIGSVTGTVRNSCSAAVLNGISAKGSPYKCGIRGGGLVGFLSGTSAEITGSYSSGSIDKFNFAGGLVGNAANSKIRNCYSTANITNGINDIGGLVGVADAATISNCYALGSLGLYPSALSVSCQGGLVGYMQNAATVEYCYSAGSVTGFHPGGLIGNSDNTGNTITDSFYNSVTSGCSDTGNGEPKTPVEMRAAGTFTNWDFNTVWDIVDTEGNCSYPYLRIATQSPVPGYGDKVPISEEPENAAVIVGENTSFNIAATGEGLVYQWQVDTGSGFSDIPDDSVHSGETTATLYLTGVTVEMNGNKYRVIVSGTGVYPKTSDIAELTVKLNTPVIKSVNAGDEHAVITWDAVADATGYIVFSSTTSGSYGAELETVSGSVYSCDATGLTNDTTYYFAVKATCGEVESDYSGQMSATPNAPMPESTAPYITEQPESITVIEGQTASFKVEVGGDEPLTYQWKKDSIEVSDGENISGADAATLTIEKVQASDGGSYSCYVSNVAGNVDSNAAILAVYPPGSFVLTADPGDRHVDLSWSTVTDAVYYDIYTDDSYTATVTGDVYYESINLINGNTYSFEVKATDGDKAVIAASGKVNATPRTVPGAPEDITAEAGNRQVIVSFTAPSDNGGSSITGYIVTAYPGGITASGGASPITVTGLTNRVTYTFTVRAVNAVGVGEESQASSPVIPYRPSDRDDTKDEDNDRPTEPSRPSETGVTILVNGRPETAASSYSTTTEGRTVTTVIIDDKKVEEKLRMEGSNTVLTIPFMNNAGVEVSKLNGQTVKNMEDKAAVLEIKTENVIYRLPAAQINIDDVSSQVGEQLELKDIAVNISISTPSQDTVRIVEDTANRNKFQIVVQPIEFSITCTNGNKTVEVSRFNGYVERMVAIPEGVDTSRITTGVVLNPDGTFSHVPTTIVVVDDKYYAKINSLTNSAYSVIYSPKVFKDVENHWAKDAVNDMGSRLVVDGVGNGQFAPDRYITRAEFTSILVKGLGLMRSGTGKAVFKDVSEKEWYYDAVSIAYENGLILGTDNGMFSPEEQLTREQAIAMLARAMNVTGLNKALSEDEIKNTLKGFEDSGEASEWAGTSVAACINTGIIEGRNRHILAPKGLITRAEVAVIIERLLEKSDLI